VLGKLNEVANAEQLNLQDGAAEAIVSLSGGDMRKVLNILESCSLAYKDIQLDKIYEVTGRPSPNDIKIIFDALMKSTHSDGLETL
jgi:replication factor C subunit 3/5